MISFNYRKNMARNTLMLGRRSFVTRSILITVIKSPSTILATTRRMSPINWSWTNTLTCSTRNSSVLSTGTIAPDSVKLEIQSMVETSWNSRNQSHSLKLPTFKFQHPSTGETVALLPQLKIKDIAVNNNADGKLLSRFYNFFFL